MPLNYIAIQMASFWLSMVNMKNRRISRFLVLRALKALEHQRFCWLS
jgi:hypothetical protein